MTISHVTSVRDQLADLIDDQVNTGAGANGTMDWKAGATVVGTFNFQDPAFGASASGTITLQGTPLTVSAGASGTLDGFDVKDKDGNVVFSGTITATGGGGDIEVDNTSANSGQNLTLDSFSYSAPA